MSADPRQPAIDARGAHTAPGPDMPGASPQGVWPLLSHDIFALQDMGGVSRYAAELHKALRRLGVPSMVLAPLHKSDFLSNVDHVAGLRIPPRLRLRGTGRLAFWTGRLAEPPLLALLRRRHPGLVLHRTYYSAQAPSPRTATVITVYDMAHELHREAFSPDDPTSARKRVWCDQANAIVAISHYTKAQLVALFGIDAARVIVSHPGVNSVVPDPQTLDTLRARRPYLLYVGKRRGYKNFERLVTAYARSQALAEDVELVAFGGEAPSASEQTSLAGLGIDRHVSFARGDDAVLAAYYASTVGLLYPSLDEGFGFPPLEAMLQGCVVAAANAGAIPEVVADAALLFDPMDLDSMTTAIDRIASDTALRANLVSRGPSRAAMFTWDATAETTLAAYDIALELNASRF